MALLKYEIRMFLEKDLLPMLAVTNTQIILMIIL